MYNVNSIQAAPNVIVIPALSKEEISISKRRQKRVGAYCRVSTDQEEQQNSYQTQIAYYTDYINSKPEWCMAGIFADEGISGTQTKKRTQFNRMIKRCKQKKIDLILCKSISRFARNTVDCLEYIRQLRSLGIGVMFEKENIDTLNMTSEFIIALYGSFAQAESESISKNVTWGIEKQFREGKVKYQMTNVLGYRMGSNGKPYIVEKEAQIVRRIYDLFLDGMSLERIAVIMETEGAKRRNGRSDWQKSNVRSILNNEKYVGDAILQKSFTTDCITHKRSINYGDKAKYLVHDCHDAIIDRDTYNRTQQELAKRSSMIKRSDKTKTDHGKYSSIYALSEILICGECGSSYRRVTWNVHGKKSIVWRCINRLDHGTRYCKDSPSIHEDKLHAAIAKAMNKIYSGNSEFMSIINQNIACVLSESDEIGQAISKMESRIKEIEKQRDKLIELVTIGALDIEASDDKFKALKDEESYLRNQILQLQEQAKSSDDLRYTLSIISEELKKYSDNIIEYDDIAVRKVIDCIKVMSKNKICITFKGGFEMEAEIEP